MKRPFPPCPGATARQHGRRLERAYTVVEVLMSMAVLAVGIIGVIAMEKITVASSTHAKNLSTATHIAQAWLAMLEAEGTVWGQDGTFTRTTWLTQVSSNPTTWFRPTWDGTQLFGPAFDAIGNPVADADQATCAKYCVDLRLSPLNSTVGGAGLIRAEVRVVWLRDQELLSGGILPVAQPCGIPVANVDDANYSPLLHFVYMSGAVRQVVSP
jgi:Tfp pilus assembly protein PilV